MEYVVLRDEETGKVEKIGRFREDGIGEQFFNNRWESDSTLYSDLFDGLLEDVLEAEVKKIIANQIQLDKIAA